VTATTVRALSAATEKAAEAFARDLLADPAFRAEMRTIIRTAFARTVRGLRNGHPARRRRRRGTRRK
jgi:hypothetical protein